MNKREINKAIIKVITSKYKKDCKESAIMLKNNGYFIEKRTGEKFYNVYSYKTFKNVYISLWAEKWDYNNEKYYDAYKVNIVKDKEFKSYAELINKLEKIDFVAYLEKPFNITWAELKRKRFDEKNGFVINRKIELFKDLKHDIKVKEVEINNAKEQINFYIGELTEYTASLENLKCRKRALIKGGK